MAMQAIREHFLAEGIRFVRTVSKVPGVRRIALIGSILTSKANPKDIDFLVTVDHAADLAPLARCARRLQGTLQGLNKTADVFLADESGSYLGRTCRWRDCRPAVRTACDALHCGRRPYLHDDLEAITLDATLLARPPLIVWPKFERATQIPRDVEDFLKQLELVDARESR